MDWPRFQLTPDESKYSGKYEDPRSNKQRVLRRFYYNEFNINPSTRRDTVTFQISRRARVFGLTGSGDIDRFLIELIDVTGEQYTAGEVHLSNLLLGWNPDPLSPRAMDYSAGVPTNILLPPPSAGPFIQEPNIVLRPNQTLNINMLPAIPDDLTNSYRVGLVLHVWEFPGMAGSPL